MATDASSFAASIHALVVGVGEYSPAGEGAALSGLPGCPAGAHQVAAALVDPRACRIPPAQVACLTQRAETDKSSIMWALAEMARRAGAGDVIFFYFAGHGMDRPEGYYLATADSSAVSAPDASISAHDIVESLKGTLARGVLIVLDCCGGAGLVERAPQLLTEFGDRFDYRILISASTSEERSWELPGEGSPFTGLLVDAISGRLPAMGRQGEIYFRDLYGFLVVEMDKIFKGRLRELVPQRPNAAPFYREEPLLFVNSDASLHSIRLDTARFSPNEVQAKIRAAVAIVAGVLLAVALSAWTWQDQHLYAQRFLPSGLVDVERGYPGWRLFGYPKPVWQVDLRADDVDSGAPLSRTGFLVMAAGTDPFAELLGQLSKVGRAKLQLQTAQYARAAETARNALGAIPDPHSEAALDADDTVVAAAYAQPAIPILDLLGGDKMVVSRTLQALAAKDVPTLEQALGRPDLQEPGRFDHDLVFSAFPAACSPALGAYVQRALGNSWTFDEASADMVVRTRCMPSGVSGPLDWHRIASDQARMRLLLGQTQDPGLLTDGFSRFVAEIAGELAAGPTFGTNHAADPYFQLSHAMDAAVVFDLPGFGCSPQLTALLERANEEHDDVVGNDDRTRFARYVGTYCRGVAALGQSDDGSPQFRIGGSLLVTVPATELTKEDVGRMAQWNADIVERLALTQVAGRSRPNEKLAFVPYIPNTDSGLSIVEQIVTTDDESLQVSGLAWVLSHRKDDFMPLIRRVLPQLRDDALLAAAVMARDEEPIKRELASLVVGSPQSEGRRAAWLMLWGDEQQAFEILTTPSLASRTAAIGCLTFRDDLTAIRERLASSSSPVLTRLLDAIDRGASERQRLQADMSALPLPHAEWRAHIDWSTTLGGRLLLRSLAPDATLELR
jgi:hypothetical protein